MMFLAILPYVAFFGSLVAGAPVKPINTQIQLDMEQLFLLCEVLPPVVRPACYVLSQTALEKSAVLSNGTLSTSTPSTILPSAADLCAVCDDLSGEPGTQCQVQCERARAYITTPWVPNGRWDFCKDGCEAHNCEGPYYAQCFSNCLRCFDGEARWDPQWYPGVKPDPFDPRGCFCPALEYS